MNEFNYYFKVRPAKDVAFNLGVIYKDLGYNKIDKNKISQIYNITSQDINDTYYLNNFAQKVQELNDKESIQLTKLCEQLQQKWKAYRSEYFNIISRVFGIEFNCDFNANTYCYLQFLPINEIDLKDNIIYLDCNREVDEIFKNFVIMLTKLVLIARWNDVNDWNFNIEFDVKNKVLMFVEIAIDAIFANSDLVKICANPTYKYFYSLRVKDVNTMDYFRQLYNTISLDDFFTEVYMFVHTNYTTLLQFKNYLY
ncbi:MAG: hypothetical protein IJ371_05160 [Clostridia bacterium]|nr:hypothetical protein [Clostridia bacterium]